MSGFDREKRFKTRSEQGTLAIAATIAEMLPAPRVVVLTGDLGAGKTTLVKGWLAALGAAEADAVMSPTFTLVHEYEAKRGIVFHLDLYRLESERELAPLGLEEMAAAPDALMLMEWGERFPLVMALADAQVRIAHLDGDERSFEIVWRERRG